VTSLPNISDSAAEVWLHPRACGQLCSGDGYSNPENALIEWSAPPLSPCLWITGWEQAARQSAPHLRGSTNSVSGVSPVLYRTRTTPSQFFYTLCHEYVREALLKVQERCFQPAIRNGRHCDRQCKANHRLQRIGEEDATVIVDQVVEHLQDQRMENIIKAIRNASQGDQHSAATTVLNSQHGKQHKRTAQGHSLSPNPSGFCSRVPRGRGCPRAHRSI